MTTYAATGYVAVVPFEVTIEKEVRKGIALAKQKTALIETKVVFGDKDNKYLEGDTVYLRGDCIQLPWARESFQIGDKKFVLVPINEVRAVTLGKELSPGVTQYPPVMVPFQNPVPDGSGGNPWFDPYPRVPYEIWCSDNTAAKAPADAPVQHLGSKDVIV